MSNRSIEHRKTIWLIVIHEYKLVTCILLLPLVDHNCDPWARASRRGGEVFVQNYSICPVEY